MRSLVNTLVWLACLWALYGLVYAPIADFWLRVRQAMP